ncbi:MAG: hypothetical protein WDO19_22380 [Bacteroidota bacterium]
MNFDKNFPDEQTTTNGFCDYIKQKKPLFGFMHLDHVDHAGACGWPWYSIYYKAVSKADSLIGQVLQGNKRCRHRKKYLADYYSRPWRYWLWPWRRNS